MFIIIFIYFLHNAPDADKRVETRCLSLAPIRLIFVSHLSSRIKVYEFWHVTPICRANPTTRICPYVDD